MVKITFRTGSSQIFAFWTDQSTNNLRRIEGRINTDIGAWDDKDADVDSTNSKMLDYCGPLKIIGGECNPEAGSITIIIGSGFDRKQNFTVTAHTDQALPTVERLTGDVNLI